ncbi:MULTISPECIES: hypothetical protein [unclassified Streptomyces]|uniref:hypothetical protein n=1 Tax=unclassified Streptomyces TaxID=2593676 RepID=UPI0004C3628C
MPNPISSLPVLRGRGGAVLTAEDLGLVLDLPREQITFTPDGLGRIRAEGRSVLIELRAKAGTTPRVHRIDDVDAADAVRFAEGVNAILANRTDSDDVDGTPFALIRSLAPTWWSTFRRRFWRGVLGSFLVFVALCVLAAVLGEGELLFFLIPLGGLAWLSLCCGTYGTVRARRERFLTERGVTVTAVRATTPGGYFFPDGTGDYRCFSHPDAGPALTVAHPPGNPADVLVLSTPFTQFANTLSGPVLLIGGALLALLNGALAVGFLID